MSSKDDKKDIKPEKAVVTRRADESTTRAKAALDEELAAKRSQRRATAYGRARGCA